MIRTLILTEKEGWHFQQLKKSLESINHYVFSGCLSNITLSLVNNQPKLFINEKTIPQLYTSYFLSKNNIKTPDTFVFRGYEKAKNFLDNEMSEKGIVYKPLFGSQGDNVKLIKHPSELKEIDNSSNIYYFQDYLDNTVNHDYRILVIRNNDTCKYFYMTRYGDTFINNVSKGGSCVKEPLNKAITDLALKASRLLNMSFCGVDIMSCNNNNYIIEINSIPAWRGLQDVEEEIISDYFVNLLMA